MTQALTDAPQISQLISLAARAGTHCEGTHTRLGSRRLGVSIVISTVLLLGLATTAAAAPTVSFSAGFAEEAHLAEGTTVSERIGFAGSEYFGDPLPLTELIVQLPKGTALSN